MIRTLAIILCILALSAWSVGAEVSWDNLPNIKTRVVGTQSTVDFSPAVVALNGKSVTIRGWITPINLGDGGSVTSFLLTGTPGTCPFCLGYGPEDFVLVSTVEPVPIDLTTELLLAGRFELTPQDPTGFYYRLREARVICHP
jgi:hypothetical protein